MTKTEALITMTPIALHSKDATLFGKANEKHITQIMRETALTLLLDTVWQLGDMIGATLDDKQAARDELMTFYRLRVFIDTATRSHIADKARSTPFVNR